MSFLNTEQTFSNSGTAGTWIARELYFSSVRNSGGIVNIAGPAIIGHIIPQTASGQGSAVSASGVQLRVLHATSGLIIQSSGLDTLYNFEGGTSSGLTTTGTTSFVPPTLMNLNFLARSGVVVYNNGTHLFDLVVTYAVKQA